MASFAHPGAAEAKPARPYRAAAASQQSVTSSKRARTLATIRCCARWSARGIPTARESRAVMKFQAPRFLCVCTTAHECHQSALFSRGSARQDAFTSPNKRRLASAGHLNVGCEVVAVDLYIGLAPASIAPRRVQLCWTCHGMKRQLTTCARTRPASSPCRSLAACRSQHRERQGG